MSDYIEKMPILAIDTSTAMLHVLKNFASKQGYEAECFSDPADACVAIAKRFQRFDTDYRCVVLGWPEGKLGIVTDLLGMLGSPDHRDLPLIIVSQEPNEDVQTLVRRRPKTRTLLWKDYQQAAGIIEQLAPDIPAHQAVGKSSETFPRAEAVDSALSPAAGSAAPTALLLDDSPSVCHSLRNIMESNGYHVTVASTIDEGKAAIRKYPIDIVITDFFLRGEGGEEFCRYLQTYNGKKPVCVVTTTKYSDAIIKRSLAVGAIACFYKNESTELLFARIDALVTSLPKRTGAGVSELLTSQILDLTEEPALLLSAEGIILGLNSAAETLLDSTKSGSLVGAEFKDSVTRTAVNSSVKNACAALFKSTGKGVLTVNFRARDIAALPGVEPCTLITFSPLSRVESSVVKNDSAQVVVESESVLNPAEAETVAVSNHAAADLQLVGAKAELAEIDSSGLDKANALRSSVQELFDHSNRDKGLKYFALMMDVQLIAVTGDRLSIGDSEPMLKIVSESFRKLYPKEGALAYIGEGQFMPLLATRGMQDALMLTRKLLQVTPQMLKYLNNMTLVSHCAVLNLDDTSEDAIDPLTILQQCRKGCAKTRRAGRDNTALVLALNQYLTASGTAKQSQKQGEAEPA